VNHVTPTGHSVRDWIAEHWAAWGYGPTVREVQRHFGWKSSAGAAYHLHRLREAGHVTWNDGEPRSIKPTKGETT